MLQIFLIRPGATDYDEQKRIQGNLDIPLNAQGNRRASELACELQGRGIETLYFAPGQAAQQTAQCLAAAWDIRSKRIDQWENLNHGLWQGMLVDDVRHKHPKVYRQWQEQPQTVCPPQGETLPDCQKRIQTALKKLLKKHRQGTVALVAPEPVASLLRAALDHGQVGDLWRAAQEHGRWEILAVEHETNGI